MTGFHELARTIDMVGIAAVEDEISTLVDTASRSGVNPAVLSVLADISQPEAARLRALARVRRDLESVPPLIFTAA